MKKLKIVALAAIAAAALAGCHTAHFEVLGDGKWKADIYDNLVRREIKTFTGKVKEGGQFEFAINGYQTDTSEQLPAFTREMWSGLAVIGRLAGATVNPAVASVPLTQEAANAADVERLVKANAELKAQVAAAKAEAAKAGNGEQGTGNGSACADGSCEVK
jgi:hypothetical protein